MCYPPVKVGDDVSSGFWFTLLTYAHTYIHTHMYRAAKHPTHAFDYEGGSDNAKAVHGLCIQQRGSTLQSPIASVLKHSGYTLSFYLREFSRT